MIVLLAFVWLVLLIGDVYAQLDCALADFRGACAAPDRCDGLSVVDNVCSGAQADFACCIHQECTSQTDLAGVCRSAAACSGSAFAVSNGESRGCSVQFPSETVCCVPKASDGSGFFVPTPPPPSEAWYATWWIWVVGAGGLILIVLVICCGCIVCLLVKRRRDNTRHHRRDRSTAAEITMKPNSAPATLARHHKAKTERFPSRHPAADVRRSNTVAFQPIAAGFEDRYGLEERKPHVQRADGEQGFGAFGSNNDNSNINSNNNGFGAFVSPTPQLPPPPPAVAPISAPPGLPPLASIENDDDDGESWRDRAYSALPANEQTRGASRWMG